MTAATWGDVVERARQLALSSRSDAREMEARRVALSRFALVWWQGEAAESYARRVHDRVNALAALAVELDALAVAADDLADRVLERVAAEAAGWWSPC